MNKRQKKKLESNKPTLQEAWDIVAEHLSKNTNGRSICFFVMRSCDERIEVHDADHIFSLKTTQKYPY